jgi:hypothetical protein
MDTNWLVQLLMHGEVYNAQNSDGSTYQVTRAPTNLTIKAAKVIQQLSNQLQQNAEIIQNLMRQLNNANNELELFYKQRQQEAQVNKQ